MKNPKTKLLAPRTKFNKDLLATTLVVLVVACGYLLYRNTRAASAPPSPPASIIALTAITNVKTSDGLTGTSVICFANTYTTSYGWATYCINGFSGQKKSRFGIYNVTAKTFLPQTSWLPQGSPFYGIGPQVGQYQTAYKVANCPGQGYGAAIYGSGPVTTSVGPVYYGEIFRVNTSTGGWQQSQGTYSPLTKACAGSGKWYPVGATFN